MRFGYSPSVKFQIRPWSAAERAELTRLFVDCDLDGPDLQRALAAAGWPRSQGAVDLQLIKLGLSRHSEPSRMVERDLARTRAERLRLAEAELRRQVVAAREEIAAGAAPIYVWRGRV